MSQLAELAALLSGRRVVALTGAGISTESGIPDYRGEGTRRRARAPMQHATFVSDPEARRTYWARSYVGWPRIAAARPNPAHHALAALERDGAVAGVITQNVDGLHGAAGSRHVIELHGALADVVCLECGHRESRARVQERLARLNPDVDRAGGADRPDGDVELGAAAARRFRVADCEGCGGALMPDVVFFGGAVPRRRTEAAWALYREADVLLVIGSSLAVFSGFRFVRQAARDGLPVAIVNRGETRGDELCTLKLDGRAGELVPGLAARLTSRAGSPRP